MNLSMTVPGSNATQREHLETNIPDHKWLVPFEASPYELYIMSVFWQLNRDRQWESMSGTPRSTSLQTLVFYQQLFNDVLNTDEIALIQHIDAVYINTVAELRKDENG